MALANCGMNPEALQLFVGYKVSRSFGHVGHLLNPPFWATVSRQNAPGRAKDNARLWGRVERLTDYTWNRTLFLWPLGAFVYHIFGL